MGDPHWWAQRRFGVMIQANLATVPAWAPIGEYASWYRAHVDPDTHDVLLHPSPLVETLAHHRDRWAHVDVYDDFLPFLTFDEFDPDDWTELARDAGAGYVVMVAKHHDGWCWWDAPGTDRTVLHGGPGRNVLAELAAACERADLVFGVSYSLLDWGDERYPGCAYVDSILHPHVLDLVRRYGVRMLWGDGHWGAGSDHWRSDELMAAARAIEPELLVNDRWWASEPGVRTFEYRLPADIVDEPWEMRRGLGTGVGVNRMEQSEHLITPAGIVALLTEVVAKGGHLLLCIGPDARGRVPDLYAERLRGAGGWIRRHVDLVNRGRPWTIWGDADCRYIVVDDVLHVVDVSGTGRFRALTRDGGVVRGVATLDGEAMGFEQDDDGLTLERRVRRRARLPVVYRIDHDEPPAAPIELFASATARAIELVPLLADARRGDIVQLGDGRYVGPARVPDGVIVRGLGPERTTVDGLEGVAAVLGEGSRLAHCTVTGGGDRIVWLPKPVLTLAGEGANLLGCHVDGHVEVTADHTRITSCRMIGVLAKDVDHVEILRSSFAGMEWDCAIELIGGTGHVIEGCEFRKVLQAIRLESTIGAQVRGNQVRSRWWGVQLVDTDGSVIFGNSFGRAMRAVDIDGGTLAQVTGNAVSDGDSGCLVQRGASDVEVSGNHWERCRVGLMAWDAGTVRHYDNTIVDLLQPDDRILIGP